MDPEDGDDETPVTWHRYVYAGDEPVDQTDPTGNEYDMASVGAAIEVDAVLSTLATVSLISAASELTCEAQRLAGGPMNPDCPKPDFFYRYGTTYEFASKLKRQATAAMTNPKGIGILGIKGLYGVSVRPYPRGFDESHASRTAILGAGFGLVPTPVDDDPLHFTLTLPNPVTDPVALTFNTIFGRTR